MNRGFGSDNFAGVLPQVMQALNNANTGHAKAYGYDQYSDEARNQFDNLFGRKVKVFFSFNGTGANVLALSCATRSYHAVICAETAHINVDECGAPQKHTGTRLLTINTPDGKLRPEYIAPFMHSIGDEHHNQPRVISISQCTELGTTYQPHEIKALCDFAHKNNMVVHVDGARLANALAWLNKDVREVLVDTGVDMVSFGGTKNGMMFGEAVVFLNTTLADEALFLRKQMTQLNSKMRFIAVQFSAMLTHDLWLNTARKANEMAQLLSSGLEQIDGISLCYPTQANEIFVHMPRNLAERMQQHYFFYPWNEDREEYRLVCAYDITPDDIDHFLTILQQELKDNQ